MNLVAIFFLYCSIENKMYVFANVYIPPPFKLEIFYRLMEFMVDKVDTGYNGGRF